MEKLYGEDYTLWLEKTAEQLRHKNLEQLDWERLLEEIEDLGKSQRNAVESYLRQLLKYLLLYQYWTQQKDYCADGWADEIDNFRNELEILLRSKTLQNYAGSTLEATYQKARNSACRKSKLDELLLQCPYGLGQVLDTAYLPE